jgi:hypothetical protein
LEEWESLAALDPHLVHETLVARHNRRMAAVVHAQNEQLYLPLLDALAQVSFLMKVLHDHGAPRSRQPSSYGGNWPSHLAWGVSSVVSAARLAFAGQYLGAALVARHQLERWTAFSSFNTDTPRVVGESSVDYTARVWTTFVEARETAAAASTSTDEPTTEPAEDDTAAADELIDSFDEPEIDEAAQDHRHVLTPAGGDICPSALMGALGELLHADGPARTVLAWDAFDLCEPDPPDVVFGANLLIADAIRLSLMQIRVAVIKLAFELGDKAAFRMLIAMPTASFVVGTRTSRRTVLRKRATLSMATTASRKRIRRRSLKLVTASHGSGGSGRHGPSPSRARFHCRRR